MIWLIVVPVVVIGVAWFAFLAAVIWAAEDPQQLERDNFRH